MQSQLAQVAKRPVTKAFLRAIDRFSVRERLPSGVFRLVDEFAGIDRLDRIELDETDDDLLPPR